MADCDCVSGGKVLVLGHSFVHRLSQFLDGEETKIRGHKVEFLGFSGATARTLRDKLRVINISAQFT